MHPSVSRRTVPEWATLPWRLDHQELQANAVADQCVHPRRGLYAVAAGGGRRLQEVGCGWTTTRTLLQQVQTALDCGSQAGCSVMDSADAGLCWRPHCKWDSSTRGPPSRRIDLSLSPVEQWFCSCTAGWGPFCPDATGGACRGGVRRGPWGRRPSKG